MTIKKYSEQPCGCWWEYYDDFPCSTHFCPEHQAEYCVPAEIAVNDFSYMNWTARNGRFWRHATEIFLEIEEKYRTNEE